MSKNGFRLPTEAEWEYAARGGKNNNNYTYSGSNTVGNVAWYNFNSSYEPHTVKTKAANTLGIYDMSGNVAEWCFDNWKNNYNGFPTTPDPVVNDKKKEHIIRGGSHRDNADSCRVYDRNTYNANSYHREYGARVVLRLPAD